MAIFQSKKYRPRSTKNANLWERIGIRYRANLNSHPFLLFGLPFITIMVASSFLLTPATALRYERHDRKVRMMSQEEAMGLGIKGSEDESLVKRNTQGRLIGSEKDEYYRLMAKDLDDWEQQRVKRFKGEPDGRL